MQPYVPSSNQKQVSQRNGHGAIGPEFLFPMHQIHGKEREQQQTRPVQRMGQDEGQTRHSAFPLLFELSGTATMAASSAAVVAVLDADSNPSRLAVERTPGPADERSGQRSDGVALPREASRYMFSVWPLIMSGVTYPRLPDIM